MSVTIRPRPSAQETILAGGRAYRFVQKFPQGEHRQWYLCQRVDLPPAPQ